MVTLAAFYTRFNYENGLITNKQMHTHRHTHTLLKYHDRKAQKSEGPALSPLLMFFRSMSENHK